MPEADLLFRPLQELSHLVRRGELSARELVTLSLERIEALEPHINAFVDVDADRALAAADAIGTDDPRPLAGVPVAIKNNVPVEDLRFTLCADLLGDFEPDHDAHLVSRLRRAGAIVVGTTALPEYGILPTTESRRHGPTRNPWDRDRTPGGSSGGSAAAVAAGMVPLAHANDGGGSTRIPAACCGLVGLKPSRGRISRGPDIGDSFLVCDGVLTRTVTETATLLDVLAGYEVGDATWAPRPAEPYATAITREPGRLRIAVTRRGPLGEQLDPECERAWRETASLLEQLGHEVFERDLPIPGEGTLELFTGAFGPQVALGIAFGGLLAGRVPTEADMEPLSWALYQAAKALDAVDHALVMTQLQAMARMVVGTFADCDLLLTPALAERPLPIGECTGMGAEPLRDFARSGRFTPYTALFNVTGQPAISVPVSHGEDGLPSAVQLVGGPLAEDTLLQVALQLERATQWPRRDRPALPA